MPSLLWLGVPSDILIQIVSIPPPSQRNHQENLAHLWKNYQRHCKKLSYTPSEFLFHAMCTQGIGDVDQNTNLDKKYISTLSLVYLPPM